MSGESARTPVELSSTMRALRQLARTFFPQLKKQLFNRATLIAMGVAGILGLLLPSLFSGVVVSSGGFSAAVILASYGISFLALGYLLASLPSSDTGVSHWRCLGAWLSSLVVALVAFATLTVRAWDFEPPAMMAALWLLFAAQSGLVVAAHGLFTLLFNRTGELARTASMLLLCVLVSSLFWTKPLIHAAGKEPLNAPAQRHNEIKLSDHIITAVTKLNLPLAISAVWFLHSRAGKPGYAPEGARFDLIRGALTYSVWIGSAQGAPYPQMLPEWRASLPDEVTADSGGFSPGLLLVLLAWSLPLIVLADVLVALAEMRTRSALDIPLAVAAV